MVALMFTSLTNLFRPTVSRLSRLSQANSVNLSTSTSISSQNADRPKRPLNAYFAFYVNKRNEITRLKPDLKNTEIVSQIGNAWKTLSPHLKKEYEEQSAERFSDFKKLHLKWWKGLSTDQQEEFLKSKERERKKKEDRRLKKKLRELGMPRRPLRAFNFFMSTTLQLSKDKTNISPKEQFGKVAHSWKSMNDEEKKPYIDMELKDIERHAKEMIAWEKKMEKEGHTDVVHQTNSKETSTDEATTKKRGSSSTLVKKPIDLSRKAK